MSISAHNKIVDCALSKRLLNPVSPGKGLSAELIASVCHVTDTPEPKVKVARISNAPESARGSVVQMSGTPVAEDELVPEPQ